ncbi:hypothetical protein H6F61_24100 [Cyanobacteria bacterium FACHB-472]|nr:hypothetical protein [Cyanobacteria bacterium FACHB-472]
MMLQAHFCPRTKENIEDESQQELSALRRWINPYDSNRKDCLHIYDLIEAAINIAKPSSMYESKQVKVKRTKFIKEAWQPYLYARQMSLKRTREGYVQDGKKVTSLSMRVKVMIW